jgi:hypothetical protein
MALLKENVELKVEPTCTKIINGQPITYTSTVVHSFVMYDYQDFEIEVADPLFTWQSTEKGQWVLAHAIEPPIFHKSFDTKLFGTKVYIVARLTDQDLTFFKLKWE